MFQFFKTIDTTESKATNNSFFHYNLSPSSKKNASWASAPQDRQQIGNTYEKDMDGWVEDYHYKEVRQQFQFPFRTIHFKPEWNYSYC